MDAMILLILQMGDGGFRSDLPKVTFLRSIELKYKLQYNGNPDLSSAKEAQASEDPEIISFSGKLMKTTYEPLVVIHWRNIFVFVFFFLTVQHVELPWPGIKPVPPVL